MRQWINLFENHYGNKIRDLSRIIKTETGATADLDILHDISGNQQIYLAYLEGGRGSGAKALQIIFEFADQHQLPIILTVLENAPKLIRYYLHHGFVMQGFRSQKAAMKWLDAHEASYDEDNIDPDDEDVGMMRLPVRS